MTAPDRNPGYTPVDPYVLASLVIGCMDDMAAEDRAREEKSRDPAAANGAGRPGGSPPAQNQKPAAPARASGADRTRQPSEKTARPSRGLLVLDLIALALALAPLFFMLVLAIGDGCI